MGKKKWCPLDGSRIIYSQEALIEGLWVCGHCGLGGIGNEY